MMELKTITKMYFMDSKIKCIYVFLLLLLLSSCGKNRDVSEFVVDPPDEYKVEYIKDTIRITDIDLNDPTEKDNVSFLVKKNGKYYSNGELMMSTEEHTDSFLTTMYSHSPIQGVCMTRKIGKNLYSYKMYFKLKPHHWEIRYAIYYDKSYRIIKFQDKFACDFMLKK